MPIEVDVPSTWTQMKPGERFTKVEIEASSTEYKRIEQSARSTSQNTVNQILKVFRSVVIVQYIYVMLHFYLLHTTYSFL